MRDAIIVNAHITVPVGKVWEFWTAPEHITKWCFASDDWEAPEADNNVQVGGTFSTLMAAKDKSTEFRFGGVYTAVEENKLLEYTIDDGRKVRVSFEQTPEGTNVTEEFEPEQINSKEMQAVGWQSILDNFKQYAENTK